MTTTPAQKIIVRITGKHRSRLPGGMLHLSEVFAVDLRPIDLSAAYICLTNLTVTNAREMLRSRGYTPLHLQACVELWIDNLLTARTALSEEKKQCEIEWFIPDEERETLLRTIAAHAEEREYLSNRLSFLRHKKELTFKFETQLPRLKEEYENVRRSYDPAVLKQGYGTNPETVLEQIAKCEERIFSKTDAVELEELEAKFQDPFY